MNVPYVLQMPKGVKNNVWGFQALEYLAVVTCYVAAGNRSLSSPGVANALRYTAICPP